MFDDARRIQPVPAAQAAALYRERRQLWRPSLPWDKVRRCWRWDVKSSLLPGISLTNFLYHFQNLS